jgi:sorting and assembly machinery component 37
MIAAHILLLVNPPFPGSLIKDLVNNSYPALISYAQRVYDQAFEEGRSPIQITSPSFSFSSLIPSWPTNKAPDLSGKSKSQEDISFNLMSWGFIGLAIGSLTAYLVVFGKIWEQHSEEMQISEGETP